MTRTRSEVHELLRGLNTFILFSFFFEGGETWTNVYTKSHATYQPIRKRISGMPTLYCEKLTFLQQSTKEEATTPVVANKSRMYENHWLSMTLLFSFKTTTQGEPASPPRLSNTCFVYSSRKQ